MALPKKKSRKINVNNTDYYYVLSTGKPDENRNFNLNLTVQCASGDGRLLKITGLVTRDFWLDFPNSSKKEDYPMITPKDTSNIITLGIEDGWNSNENGKPYIMKLDNSIVRKYSIK